MTIWLRVVAVLAGLGLLAGVVLVPESEPAPDDVLTITAARETAGSDATVDAGPGRLHATSPDGADPRLEGSEPDLPAERTAPTDGNTDDLDGSDTDADGDVVDRDRDTADPVPAPDDGDEIEELRLPVRSGDPVGDEVAPEEAPTDADVLGELLETTPPADLLPRIREVVGRGFEGPGDLVSDGTGGHDGPAAGPGGFAHGSGCAVSCITSAVAYALGTTALLDVKTDTPANIHIFVWDGAGYFEHRHNNGALMVGFSGSFNGLEAGTTYEAAAIAIDAAGQKDERYGSFTTRTRVLRVTFAPFEVTDHPYAGPLRAHYWIDGEWRGELMQERPASDPNFVSRQLVLHDVGPATSVMVQVVDRGGKKSGFDSCGTAELPADVNWSGHEECASWSNAPNFWVHLAGASTGASKTSPHVLPPFTLYGAGPKVWFQVPVVAETWFE